MKDSGGFAAMNITCEGCGLARYKYSGGLCRRCYNLAHPRPILTCEQCGALRTRSDTGRFCRDCYNLNRQGHTKTCPLCGGQTSLDAKNVCRACFARPEVRRKYGGNKGKHTYKDGYRNSGAQIEPTGFPPGSEDKIEVLRQRAERMAPLHHPLDAGCNEKITLPKRGKCREIVINGWERLSATGVV